MLRIGLTGGIATGKSTVSSMLKQLGAVVLDADQIAREIVEPGQLAWHEIRKVFGEEYFFPDGRLDRRKLGGLVFADEQARKTLEAITHSHVYCRLEAEAKKQEIAGERIVVFDIPLLFETGYRKIDKIIVVYAPFNVQLQRLMKRNGLTMAEAKQRIAAQMPIEKKVMKGDFVIDNSGDLKSTEKAVQVLWQKLVKLSQREADGCENCADCS